MITKESRNTRIKAIMLLIRMQERDGNKMDNKDIDRLFKMYNINRSSI